MGGTPRGPPYLFRLALFFVGRRNLLTGTLESILIGVYSRGDLDYLEVVVRYGFPALAEGFDVEGNGFLYVG